MNIPLNIPLKHLHLIYFFSLVLLSDIFAQSDFQPAYVNYTVEDGLPSNETYCVHQDKNGYIWIGTDRGLVKYNGYEFTTFTTKDGLPDNIIFDIYEDYVGRLWLITFNKSIYYIEDDNFIEHPFNDDWLAFINQPENELMFINSIVVDSYDQIFVGSQSNGYFIITESGIRKIDHKNKFGTAFSANISQIESQLLTYKSIHNHEFNSSDSIPLFYEKRELTKIPIKNRNTKIEFAKLDNGTIYISILNQLVEIRKDRKIKHYSATNNIVNLHSFDSTLWVLYEKGGASNNNGQHFFKNLTITSMMKDSDHGYWFCSLEKGVYYIPNLYTEFCNKKLENDDGFISITKTNEDKIFMVSRNGKLYNYENDKITELHRGNPAESIEYFEENEYLITNSGIVYDKDGVFLSMISPHRILFFEDDSLFLLTEGQLSDIYSLDRFEKKSLNEKKYIDNRIFCVHKDDDHFFIGTMNGLFSLSPPFKEINASIIHDSINKRIQKITRIENKFWLSTIGHGIIIFDAEDKTIQSISKSDGLISNNINCIIPGNDDKVWMATNNGINILNKKKPQMGIQQITSSSGLISNQIFDLETNHQFLFAVSGKGLIRIDLEKYQNRPNHFPKHHLIEVKANGNVINQEEQRSISYFENNIEIEYISLQYLNKGNINYRYRINEIDTNWYHTKSRVARFPNLNYGKYNFEVEVQNKSGIWLPLESLSFNILPAFWQNTWFIIACISFVVLIVSTILFNRYKNLILKQSLEADIERYRYRALTSQMNPHFIFNALNSIQFYILNQNRKAASKYLSKFSKLIRISFENSKEELISLEDEIEALKLYIELENLRLNNKVIVTFNIDPTLDQVRLKVPPLLIQPFVENAFLHGLAPKKIGEPHLNISLVNKGESIYCKIEDNGIGRENSSRIKKAKKLKQKKSSGVHMSRSRIRALEKLKENSFSTSYLSVTDKIDSDGRSKGTIVEMKIPKVNFTNQIDT